LPENPEVNNAGHPNTIFTDSYKLQNYILLLSILHTTRYYEDELKVTHAQGNTGKNTHTSTNKKRQMTRRM